MCKFITGILFDVVGSAQALASLASAVAVLTALRKSVMRRTVLNHICQV